MSTVAPPVVRADLKGPEAANSNSGIGYRWKLISRYSYNLIVVGVNGNHEHSRSGGRQRDNIKLYILSR